MNDAAMPEDPFGPDAKNPFGRWHLPYEEIPGGPIQAEFDVVMTDSVDVMAAVLDTDIGRFPAVVFAFRSSAPGAPEIPRLAFVGDPVVLRNVQRMVREAVQSAITAHARRGAA